MIGTRDGLFVVAAAIADDGGVVWTLPRPARHHDILHVMNMEAEAAGRQPSSHIFGQGFVLSDGTFADRTDAAIVAIRAGQVSALAHPPKLYSEDLW